MPTPSPCPADPGRVYRLVDAWGQPHPVLDDLFESLEAAWEAALAWCEAEGLLGADTHAAERARLVGAHFGMEVSTRRGDWRTLRHAIPAAAGPPAPARSTPGACSA